jgi:Flp pilus assembly protein protease CpaA
MIFNIIVVLITLLVASYHDLKKKTVPGYVMYPMILIGFFLTLLVMASYPDPLMRYANLIVACSFLVVGIVAWQARLLGGADILLIIGIILMTPSEFVSIEFYFIFLFLTCVCALGYYAIMKLAKQKNAEVFKLVPCICIGYAITIYGLFGNQVMAALAAII